ncbi:hypothetical protein FACS1894122_06370 [Alphaproteobacteria bacterium]|nr:hypothetical protein FACS1894122_06370 [Alphaproteobacteria bacterium]
MKKMLYITAVTTILNLTAMIPCDMQNIIQPTAKMLQLRSVSPSVIPLLSVAPPATPSIIPLLPEVQIGNKVHTAIVAEKRELERKEIYDKAKATCEAWKAKYKDLKKKDDETNAKCQKEWAEHQAAETKQSEKLAAFRAIEAKCQKELEDLQTAKMRRFERLAELNAAEVERNGLLAKLNNANAALENAWRYSGISMVTRENAYAEWKDADKKHKEADIKLHNAKTVYEKAHAEALNAKTTYDKTNADALNAKTEYDKTMVEALNAKTTYDKTMVEACKTKKASEEASRKYREANDELMYEQISNESLPLKENELKKKEPYDKAMAELKELEAKLDSAKSKEKDLEKKHREAKTKRQSLRAKFHEKKAKCKKLEKKCREAETVCNNLKNIHEVLLAELKEAEENFDIAHDEINRRRKRPLREAALANKSDGTQECQKAFEEYTIANIKSGNALSEYKKADKAYEEECIKHEQARTESNEALAEHRKAWTEFNEVLAEYKKAKAAFDKLLAEYRKMETASKEALATYEETKKECDKVYRKINPIGCKRSYYEVLNVSRAPNSSEAASADKLKKLLNDSGIHINEIRYMDARSMIGGMGLPDETTQEFLNLLDAEKSEVITYIKKHISEDSTFSDDVLKARILMDISEGCESKIYRDSLIVLIARTKMPKRFFSKRARDLSFGKIELPSSDSHEAIPEHLSFTSGDKSNSEYNEITLSSTEHIRLSLHFSSSTQKDSNGLFRYNSPQNYSLFHEAGHSLNSYFAHFSSSVTMDIVSRCMTMTPNDENIKYNRQFLESISESPEKQERVVHRQQKYVRSKYERNKMNPNALATTLLEHPTTPEGAARCLFHNEKETFQIMGVGVWENDEKKILCINSLSDFALNLDLGLPIRCGHNNPSLYEISSPRSSRCYYHCCALVDYVSTPIYDALFDVYGSSRSDYEAKLNPKKKANE